MKKSAGTIIIITFSLLLSGCLFSGNRNTGKDANTPLSQKVTIEQNLPKNVSLEMRKGEILDDTISIQLFVRNPSSQKIESIRSWIVFPSDVLSGVNIELPEDGSVALTAPGESIFDNEQGTAKIGFSLTEGTFFKDDMPFATLMFKKLQNKMAALSFFDARTHGHTDVLTFYEGELRSVLSDETHEPLVIETVE